MVLRLREELKIIPQPVKVPSRLSRVCSEEYARQWLLVQDFLFFLSMPHIARFIWLARVVVFGLPTILFWLLAFLVSYEYGIPGIVLLFVSYKNVRGCIISWRTAKIERLLEAEQLRKLELMGSRLD